MSGFEKVARLDDIPEGRGIAVEVHGRRIALFWFEGEVHAVESACARHHAPLERGAVSDGMLYCPWHGVPFDLDTGVCSDFPSEISGQPFAVKVENGEILIDVEAG